VDSGQFDSLATRVAARFTRRSALGLLGLAGATGLGLADDAEAKKKCKKGKKCKDKRRCPRGQIREGTVCAILCEDHEDCGGEPVFCNLLADHSARVCTISDGREPDELPPCPNRSSAECAAGQVCIDFAMVPVCRRPL
jgi:hypothetical protein